MSTSPGIVEQHREPSAEVARVTDNQRNELDDLRTRLHEKAIEAAGRAQGMAALAEQKATLLGERVAVVEDKGRSVEADLREIKATLKGIAGKVDTLTASSPVQQVLYSLVALGALGYMATWFYDRWIATGAG